jgi:hypothetical protein
MNTERVYAVLDMYDGIRSGVADYLGKPHHFEREFSDELQDFLPTFLLTSISAQVLADVLESHAIFRAWEERFHRGEVGTATHPMLPGINERFLECTSRLKAAVADPSAHTCRASAEFVPLPDQSTRPKGVLGQFTVAWCPVP